MKYNYIPFLIIIAAGMWSGCNDILETEITDAKLTVLAPQDSSILAGNEVSFAWDPIKGAENYRLQIAQPSFAEARRIVEDTLGPATAFVAGLDPGWYEWRVRGENSAYVTEYKYSKFRLDSSGNLEDYRVLLLDPADGFRTKSKTINFSWKPLELADYYLFELSGADTSILLRTEETLLEASFNMNDGSFEWQVLARENEGGRTTGSTVRQAFIDNTGPAVPEVISPGENEIFATNTAIPFEWEAVTDTDKDFKEYVLLVYTEDNEETPFFESSFTTTSNELFGPDYARQLPPGNYLWELRTVDKLGNPGPLAGQLNPFKVSP